MSSNDLEKANVLHQLKANFDVPPEMLELLKAQITEPRIAENLERIFDGLSVEDSYHIVASSLPWVKNVHSLDQMQDPKHKKKYQVPDYNLLVENNQHEDFPILIDVKSAKVEKETCKLQRYGFPNLRNYAKTQNIPLLIAVYWEKYQYWTHNTLEHFGDKGKISFADAFANDLSHILSDYIFIFNQPFYRKTYFSDIPDDNNALLYHDDYGPITSIYMGLELSSLEEISVIDNAAIDTVFDLKEIKFSKDDKGRYQIDKFELAPNCFGKVVKTTHWISRVQKRTHMPVGFRYSSDDGSNEMTGEELIRKHVVDMAIRLKAPAQYPEPKDKNPTTDELFRLAYEGSAQYQLYLNSQK